MPLPTSPASTSSADRPALAARWYDGRTSRPREVHGHLRGGPGGAQLVLQEAGTEALLLQLPTREIRWPADWGAIATADLGAHGSLEMIEGEAWRRGLASAGSRAPLADRMERRWSTFLSIALLAVALLFVFWRWGTPWAASALARQVPLEWELAISTRAMNDLDRRMLEPSRLPAARQAELQAGFAAILERSAALARPYPGYRPRVELAFRSGLGANAIALPGGQIVVTDDLVAIAQQHKLGDDAVLGVLAHELGHVMHRHTTRLLIEQAVLNVGFALALGDVSSLVSMGGSLLTGLAYLRSHEQEADCYAVKLMAADGRSSRPMGDLLQHLDPDTDEPGSALLASHPDTAARARRLREGGMEGC